MIQRYHNEPVGLRVTPEHPVFNHSVSLKDSYKPQA